MYADRCNVPADINALKLGYLDGVHDRASGIISAAQTIRKEHHVHDAMPAPFSYYEIGYLAATWWEATHEEREYGWRRRVSWEKPSSFKAFASWLWYGWTCVGIWPAGPRLRGSRFMGLEIAWERLT